MFSRVFCIVFLFCFKCNCEDYFMEGYYTETGREREGSGSSDGRKDFKTWVRLQSGSGVRDDETDLSYIEEETGSGDVRTTVAGDIYENCDRKLDLTLVLDASESIGPIGFRTIKSYTKQIVNELNLTHCDNVGLVRFTDYANSEFRYLYAGRRKDEIFARIDALEEPEKLVKSEVNNSGIALGLLVADEFVFEKLLGWRIGTGTFVVLITDGKQPKHVSSTLTVGKMVKRLSKRGIRILVLAMGKDPSTEEFLKFTTQEQNIFPERRLNDLINVLSPKENHPNVVNENDDFFMEHKSYNETESNLNSGK